MPFLNLEGLQRFMSKLMIVLEGFVPVTRKINGKPLTSDITTHTAGDGISIDGDAINVSNPIRGIISQSQFDALSEEERNTGTYIIPGLNDENSVFTPITEEEIQALFSGLV